MDSGIAVYDVLRMVGQIAGKRSDPEVAHSMEDALYVEVLQAIAGGAGNPQELAAAALNAYELEFPRWCA